jgi:adenosylhomocysteine nucleosidase
VISNLEQEPRFYRPVALHVALKEEAAALTRRLEPSTHSSPRLSLWQGFIEGTPVVLVLSGVGKVSAALAAQFVVDVFSPRCCLAVGLAGATESGSRPGELIVASGALQHDMDARPIADLRGVIPGLGMAAIPADPELSERLRLAAESVAGKSRTVRFGVILTGDEIITSRDKRDQLLEHFPSGVCFDMETAAVAQVAYQNGIPWAALRMTSDAADEAFDLEDVIGFGVGTAAGVFDTVVRTALKDL